jgi:hypothetical protein
VRDQSGRDREPEPEREKEREIGRRGERRVRAHSRKCAATVFDQARIRLVKDRS